MTQATRLEFIAVEKGYPDVVAVITLDRPETANAFNDQVIQELEQSLDKAAGAEHCRALVIKSAGRHFSAGADLGWMKSSANLDYDENIADAKNLIGLFDALHRFHRPTIALVQGAAYGGALGLVACCDISIAEHSARFCLSEVKLGLLPAVILPYLTRRMIPGQLRRLSLTARVFRGEEAHAAGLVDRVCGEGELDACLRDELALVLAGDPHAQATLKALHNRLVEDSFRQGDHTAETIAAARTGAPGQAGLAAFFAKKSPPWVRKLEEDWNLSHEKNVQ